MISLVSRRPRPPSVFLSVPERVQPSSSSGDLLPSPFQPFFRVKTFFFFFVCIPSLYPERNKSLPLPFSSPGHDFLPHHSPRKLISTIGSFNYPPLNSGFMGKYLTGTTLNKIRIRYDKVSVLLWSRVQQVSTTLCQIIINYVKIRIPIYNLIYSLCNSMLQ
jgi:hypothetical protein